MIASGYQLDAQAFEFLRMISTSEDPKAIVSKAMRQIEGMKEKPTIIGRGLLENLLQPSLAQEVSDQKISAIQDSTSSVPEKVVESKTVFHAYAEDVAADIKVEQDTGAQIDSSGTVADFINYFQDRFRRMERLLRQRIDVKTATSIQEALKTQGNNHIKMVCMITERRESKFRTILTVEDLETTATVLVPNSSSQELRKKSENLLLDQVVCLAAVKGRGNVFIAEDIILPDIAQKSRTGSAVPVYAVLTSDMHVGSTKFTKEAFQRFIMWLNGRYGNERMKEIAGHVKYVMIAGDIVDGIGIYPNQIKELAIKDIYKQYAVAAQYFEQIPDYVEIVVTPGNHDACRKALPQPAISDAFLERLQESRNIHSYGSPCTLNLHGVRVLMYHGRSLDDVVSTVPGMTHSHPEKSMRLLLQSRHLAPSYGGKTPLSPESRDLLVIEHPPDIFHAGHVHGLEHGNYRGVLIVNSGCWQGQTEYMLRNGFTPTPAIVPIVNLQTMEVNTLSFN